MTKRTIFIFGFLLFIGLLISSHAYALEIKYPILPGLKDINSKDINISDYVSYFFGIFIYIGSILALISFTIGAITFIASFNNSQLIGGAKSRIIGSLLGLILLMASFLVLKLINSNFINLSPIEALPPVEGVYLSNGTDFMPISEAVQDTSTLDPAYNKIVYKCTSTSVLLIWKFPKKNLESGNSLNGGNINVVRKNCGEEESISGTGSFKFTAEVPGVYYCLGDCNGSSCSGYMSYAHPFSEDVISPVFAGKIASIRIVGANDTSSYGVVYHEKSGLLNGGKCEKKIGTSQYSCEKIMHPEFTNAVDIFPASSSSSGSVLSGKGVTFFSEPFGWAAGSNAGFYKIEATSKEADKMSYSYTNIDRSDRYKNELCKTFQDCPGSIKVNDKYVILLESDGDYCQTFTKDVPNLKVQPIVAGEIKKEGGKDGETTNRKINTVTIISSQ